MAQSQPDIQEDALANMLAAYDDALAHGSTPPTLDASNTSVELLPRFERAQTCLHLLEEMWPRSGSPSDQADGLAFHELVDNPALTPRQIGRYTIEEKIDCPGHHFLAFRAKDSQRNLTLVLKVAAPAAYPTPDAQWRFRAEAMKRAGLNHQCLLLVYDAGSLADLCYLTTDLVDELTLRDWLDRHGRLSPFEAVQLTRSLASAVHQGHSRHLYHRYLEPGQVLIRSAVRPDAPAPSSAPDQPGSLLARIVDFGLAHLFCKAGDLPAGVRLTTLAPELLEPSLGDISPATDVYGLGVILYEALTGQQLFDEGSPDLRKRVVKDKPARPRRWNRAIPRKLQMIIRKCLEKQPRDRYPSALALSDDLRCFLTGEKTWAKPWRFLERWT